MSKLTIAQIQEIVSAITYKPDWYIHLKDDGERLYIQIAAMTLDSLSKQPVAWISGKTYLSPFMCRQEIVGAVFAAIEKAEMHEVREFFRYRGASIYNPHIDPDVLVEVARKKESFNVRDNPMSMVEEIKAAEPPALPNVRTDSFRFRLPEDYGPHEYACCPDDSGHYVLIKWFHDGGGETTYSIDSVEKNLETGFWIVV